MSKHTPGPWREEDADSLDGWPFLPIYSGGVPICEVQPDEFQEIGDETKANARLIAAAPDLLEALKFVQSDPCFKMLGSVTHDEVRAAIAKAESGPFAGG